MSTVESYKAQTINNLTKKSERFKLARDILLDTLQSEYQFGEERMKIVEVAGMLRYQIDVINSEIDGIINNV